MSEVLTSYLGFPLLVTEQAVIVRTPDGRRMGSVTSMKQARLLIKGYRRAAKDAT
jgi:hypothetical protein